MSLKNILVTAPLFWAFLYSGNALSKEISSVINTEGLRRADCVSRDESTFYLGRKDPQGNCINAKKKSDLDYPMENQEYPKKSKLELMQKEHPEFF